MNPAWITGGIVVIGFISTISATWAIIQYRQGQHEKWQRRAEEARKEDMVATGTARKEDAMAHVNFLGVIQEMKLTEQERILKYEIQLANLISDLKIAIRDEISGAITRINKLVFEDGGTSRYVPRTECDKCKERCRAEIHKRLDKIEEVMHARRSTD